jgi:hypothetical protein
MEKSPHADFEIFCHDRNAADRSSLDTKCLSRTVRLERSGANAWLNDDGLRVSSPADGTDEGRCQSWRDTAKSSNHIDAHFSSFRSSSAPIALILLWGMIFFERAEIAAVTGHSLKHVNHILEVYLSRTCLCKHFALRSSF